MKRKPTREDVAAKWLAEVYNILFSDISNR